MTSDPSPGPDERFVQQTERVRRELLDSAIPVVALTGSDQPSGLGRRIAEKALTRLTLRFDNAHYVK
ncbi:hypothetical protein F4558_002039 [Micromonospora profundi]|uniref:hypothetical protein n=1 Tax=Micromonospora profundi TaxID=1420889 RepID=UPI00143C3878|nr:hypothetical protein [Micromonospora profundi]NJC12213.1 hypothetical protein [Micromonospora profundi]